MISPTLSLTSSSDLPWDISASGSCSGMSNSLWLHGLHSPWNSLGQNTGMSSPNPGIEPRSPTLQADSLPAELPGKPKNTRVGSLSLLQGIFPSQELNLGHLHCNLDSLLAELPGKHHGTSGFPSTKKGPSVSTTALPHHCPLDFRQSTLLESVPTFHSTTLQEKYHVCRDGTN